MTTVGYGDIVQTNDREMLFNIFALFLGSLIFAYCVNSIGNILQNMNQSLNEFEFLCYLEKTSRF